VGTKTFSAGTAFLTVVPSFLDVEEAFKKQVRDMAAAADRDLAAGMARGLKEANRQAKGAGAKAGSQFAGAYESEAKKTLVKAYRSLPEPQPGVNLRKWDKALAAVRGEMKELSEQQIGIDINQRDFDTAVDQMAKKLEELRGSAPTDRGWFNANQAAQALGELQRFTDEVKRRTGEAGEQSGSAFHQGMAKALRAGLSGLPPIKLTADSSDAERALEGLRQRMLTLQSKQIGVDIDAAAAYAELRAIYLELQRLDRTKVRVDIRTNAHEAAAGMTQFISAAEQAGRSTEGIGHRAQFSMSRLEYLIALGVSVGTAIVPAAAAAAGAIGFIGTAAIGAIAGLGVLALGTSGVADAVKALNGYQQDQLKSTNSLNQAQRRMAGAADQIRMAELSLANTRRNIAEQAEDAARRVADAERGVTDARREGRQQLVEAGRAVREAQRAVTEAEGDALDVREALNDAIREATRDMAELDTALKRNSHEQEQAVTAQMAALEDLNRLKANPRATEIELRRAKESYDEQTIRLEELRNKQRELADDKARADKLGVEGDRRVIQARERVADADERVARARERLDREVEQRREAEYQASRRIADAQRQLADAQRAQTRQQLDAQFQLAQATHSLESAKRSEAQAWEQAGVAGGAALEKLNEEMSQLSPAGQRFARFLFGLKDEVLRLRTAAAEPLLPRLEEAITHGLRYLPGFEKFVGKVAEKTGDLAIAAVDAFGNPVWRRFFSYVDARAVPALQTLFDTGSNLAQGLISLYLALTPFDEPVGTGLVELSRDFAQWAERLNRTQGYQDFLDYVAANGPRVVKFLGEVGELLIDLVVAAAPLGSVVLRALTAIVDVLNSIPQPALTALVIGIGLVSLGMTTLGAVMRVIKFRQQMMDIFGPRVAQMVQTYAVETGRATEATSRFGKATATVSGMAAAAATRVRVLGEASGAVNTQAGRLATTVEGPLRRGLDSVRTAAFNAALAMNGPGGAAGAAQAAQARLIGLSAGAEVAARTGFARVRDAAFGAALAMNGPAGVAGAVQVAGGKLREFGASAGTHAAGGLNVLRRSAGSLVGFLGGPWGVAIAAATVGIGILTSKQADQKAKTDSLRDALVSLTDAYEEITAGNSGAVDGLVRNNVALQNLILNAERYGLKIRDIVAAIEGDVGARDKLMNSYNAEIGRLEELFVKYKEREEWFGTNAEAQAALTAAGVESGDELRDRIIQLKGERDAIGATVDANRKAKDAVEVLTGAEQRAADVLLVHANNARFGAQAQDRLAYQYQVNAGRIAALNGLVNTFGDVQSTATAKAEALRAAIENQTGAVVNSIEREEAWRRSLIDLSKSVEQNGATLALNTAEGLNNRDMLQATARAIREMYLEDIAAGKPIADVTKAHQGRIDKLKEEAHRLGLAEEETKVLIDAYGGVPDKITTVLETKKFDQVYDELQKLQFAQFALKMGMSPKEAEKQWERESKGTQFRSPDRKSGGGLMRGPGTTTSDSIPALLSNLEFVEPADSVDYYGVGLFEALRHKRIPKEMLPGFAGGGLAIRAPYRVELSKTRVPTLEEVLSKVVPQPSAGGIGSDDMMKILHGRFRGLPLYSGWRQGSRTANGSLSYHAMIAADGDKGRAVDIPPRKDVFDYIHDNFFKLTRELIWLGDAARNIHNGQHHRYSQALLNQHGVAGMPNAHIHWAMDEGGFLQPGWNPPIWNGTGQPEPVMSPGQWEDLHELARAGAAAPRDGNTYQFTFANTTLTPGRLRAMQAADETLARIDRPH